VLLQEVVCAVNLQPEAATVDVGQELTHELYRILSGSDVRFAERGAGVARRGSVCDRVLHLEN
jgi:hypothetical protein